MNDMLEDLEKYRILYKQTTRDMAKARQNGASSEELEEFRQKLLVTPSMSIKMEFQIWLNHADFWGAIKNSSPVASTTFRPRRTTV